MEHQENLSAKKYVSLAQGLGIAGLIVGIVTLLISFIPCFGTFALFFGFLAIMISGTALMIALIHKHDSKGLIMGGLICALLGSGIAYWQYSSMKGFADDVEEAVRKNKEIDESFDNLADEYQKALDEANQEK